MIVLQMRSPEKPKKDAKKSLGRPIAPWLKRSQEHTDSLCGTQLVSLFDKQLFIEAIQQAKITLASEPEDKVAWKIISASLYKRGELSSALTSTQRALALSPEDAELWNIFGCIFKELGLLEKAEASYTKAILLNNNFAAAYSNLGNVFQERKQFPQAIECYNRALNFDPNYADAYLNLGLTLQAARQLPQALTAFIRAAKLSPKNPNSINNLGNCLQALGRTDEAEACYQKTLELSHHYPYAHNNLGNILTFKKDYPAAEHHYVQALSAQPESVDIRNNLASLYQKQGRLTDAELLLKETLRLCTEHKEHPEHAKVLNNMGNVLKDQGKLAEAVSTYRRALALDESLADTHSNLLLATMYADVFSPATSFSEHLNYGAYISKDKATLTHNIVPTTRARPLKVGWVSADFRRHAVSYFLQPLLIKLRELGFSLYAYYNFSQQDDITKSICEKFDIWHMISGMTDEDVAELIVNDEIDILIDLSGHTAGNRLAVFAQHPAPVQVTWLGYPATTGMSSMDWRITDVHVEPYGMTEHLNTEQLWRLPEIFCCYSPSPNSPAPLPGLPCEILPEKNRANGLPPELAQQASKDLHPVTLGSFNNFAKITPSVINLWGEILSRLPHARLLLEIHGGQDMVFAADVRQRFVNAGAQPTQIHLLPRKPEHQYILYHQLDLALDPFPCNGGTTSCDCLWMGVPFVTLAGQWFVSRMGVSLLHNIGLRELIAVTPQEYVEKVIMLANNLPKLRMLRANLREKMLASPIMDNTRFGLHFAEALNGMWMKHQMGQK